MSNGTGPDYARIKAALANSRVQTSNNALYQCIYNLIEVWTRELANAALIRA